MVLNRTGIENVKLQKKVIVQPKSVFLEKTYNVGLTTDI